MATLTINDTPIDGYMIRPFTEAQGEAVRAACRRDQGCIQFDRDNTHFVAYRPKETICTIPLHADESANICNRVASFASASGPVVDWDGRRVSLQRVITPATSRSMLAEAGVAAAGTVLLGALTYLAFRSPGASAASHSASLVAHAASPGFAKTMGGIVAGAMTLYTGAVTWGTLAAAKDRANGHRDAQAIERVLAR